jgi:hypothetical protein
MALMTDKERWLIKGVVQRRLVTLVAGGSGTGKTRWLMKMITETWSKGLPVFGHESFPEPFVYCSGDRPFRSYSFTFEEMQIDINSFPNFSAFDMKMKTQDRIFTYTKEHWPETKFLIIEGYGGMVPGGKVNDYTVVNNFLNQAAVLCEKHDITLLGVVHAPKSKPGEEYVSPRQRILGSMAWSSYSEDAILIEHSPDREESEAGVRNLYLLLRNAPEEHFKMQFDGGGFLIPMPQDRSITPMPDFGPASVRSRILGQLWRSGIGPGDLFKLSLFPKSVGVRSKVSEALGVLIDDSHVKRIDKGSYRLISFPPTPKGTLLGTVSA